MTYHSKKVESAIVEVWKMNDAKIRYHRLQGLALGLACCENREIAEDVFWLSYIALNMWDAEISSYYDVE